MRRTPLLCEPSIVFYEEADDEEDETHTGLRHFLSHSFREGSLKTSVFSLTCATLGAGIVSLPYAFLCLGLVMGIAALVVLAIISTWATSLLSEALVARRKLTFEELAADVGGQPLLRFTQAVQLLFNIGAAVGYIICLHDVLAVLLNTSNKAVTRIATTIITAGVLYPLCTLDKLSSLRWASAASVLSLELLVMINIITLFRVGFAEPITGLLWPRSSTHCFRGLSLIIFSLTSQSNAPMVLAEMERPAVRRMAKVANRTAGLAVITYAAAGLSGTLIFGHHTADNLLLNYKKDANESWLIYTAFVGILIGVCLCFPMCIYPCRSSIEAPGFRQIGVPFCLVATCLVFALAVPSIGIIFSLTGSVAGASIGFLLPGVFALRCGTQSNQLYIKSLLCVVLGALVSFFGTAFSLVTGK